MTAKLALGERQWTCHACGAVLDRDVNAAVNLARLAATGVDVTGTSFKPLTMTLEKGGA